MNGPQLNRSNHQYIPLYEPSQLDGVDGASTSREQDVVRPAVRKRCEGAAQIDGGIAESGVCNRAVHAHMNVADDDGEHDMNDLDDVDESLLDDEEQTNEQQENEPLNSEDDEENDEGGDALFETCNIVICQFEKVRVSVRNWYKFPLCVCVAGDAHTQSLEVCAEERTDRSEQRR
jgi:hypothetical protein